MHFQKNSAQFRPILWCTFLASTILLLILLFNSYNFYVNIVKDSEVAPNETIDETIKGTFNTISDDTSNDPVIPTLDVEDTKIDIIPEDEEEPLEEINDEREKSVEMYRKEPRKLFANQCRNNLKNTTGWDYFKNKILKNNYVFNDIIPNSDKLDMHGWPAKFVVENISMFLDEVHENFKDEDEIRIFEVGVWKGVTSTKMGQACKNFTAKTGKPCTLLSIDTFLGSAEHFETGYDVLTLDLVFKIFLNNIKVHGLDDIVFPFRSDSSSAARALHCFKIDAHMIYIDADHDYSPVLRDIEMFYPLLKKGGVIFGDDLTWKGVSQAVNEYKTMKEDKIKYWDNRINWFIMKMNEEPYFFIS